VISSGRAVVFRGWIWWLDGEDGCIVAGGLCFGEADGSCGWAGAEVQFWRLSRLAAKQVRGVQILVTEVCGSISSSSCQFRCSRRVIAKSSSSDVVI
jgi:hypothetical protein